MHRCFLRELPARTGFDCLRPWNEADERPRVQKVIEGQPATILKGDYGNCIKKPIELIGHSLTCLNPLRKFDCNGGRNHARPCNKQLAKAAIYARKMTPAIVDAVKAATTETQRGNARAFPATASGGTPRRSGGQIAQSPPGGPRCPGCADNFRSASPARDRDPRRRRRREVKPIFWPPPSRKKDCGHKVRGHRGTQPGKCRFTEPFKFPRGLWRARHAMP